MKNINCNCLQDVNTASVTGAALDTNQWISASFQIYFGDATATGTFKLQASNDPEGTLSGGAPVNWVDIPSQTAAIASGAPALLTLAVSTYRWLRAVYTRSGGGSTTVTVNVNALSN